MGLPGGLTYVGFLSTHGTHQKILLLMNDVLEVLAFKKITDHEIMRKALIEILKDLFETGLLADLKIEGMKSSLTLVF